jgi:Clr5 domain
MARRCCNQIWSRLMIALAGLGRRDLPVVMAVSNIEYKFQAYPEEPCQAYTSVIYRPSHLQFEILLPAQLCLSPLYSGSVNLFPYHFNMSRSMINGDPTDLDWDHFKEKIRFLYLVENRNLENVRREMATKYDFEKT